MLIVVGIPLYKATEGGGFFSNIQISPKDHKSHREIENVAQ